MIRTSQFRGSGRAMVILTATVLLQSGCGTSSATAPTATAPPTVPATGLQAIVASSDLARGPNRFTFGLLDNNHPVETASPTVTFVRLDGKSQTMGQTVSATFNHFARGLATTDANSTAIEIGGVYVARATFDRAGTWGAVIKVRFGGKVRVLSTGQFAVNSHTVTPAIGSPAPLSNNPTTATVAAAKLDSGHPPDDMHRLSIAAAVAQHKPLVVLFATAAYCQSRMCGPEISVVQGLEREYRGRVNFVHIEIYKDASPQFGQAPAVKQWRLQTEPWVFVVNRSGIITAKFEGPSTGFEISSSIEATLK